MALGSKDKLNSLEQCLHLNIMYVKVGFRSIYLDWEERLNLHVKQLTLK